MNVQRVHNEKRQRGSTPTENTEMSPNPHLARGRYSNRSALGHEKWSMVHIAIPPALIRISINSILSYLSSMDAILRVNKGNCALCYF